VQSAEKIAQYGVVAQSGSNCATCETADFKRDSPSRMAIKMHNKRLRLFWII
jgi:hypothetical protein